jgi:homoserine O-acetyltransferase
MSKKFGRRIGNNGRPHKLSTGFEVEEYLHYRGNNFVKRFDANSYLYLTKAIDSFDVSNGKNLQEVFKGLEAKVLVLSFKSDWLYPSSQSLQLVRAFKLAGVDTTYCEINSTYGHDAFLLEAEEEAHLIKHFLENVTRENGASGSHGVVGTRIKIQSD